MLTALEDAVCVLRFHCFLQAARQTSPAGAQPSLSAHTAAPTAAIGAANGVPSKQTTPERLWSVPGTASILLQRCSLTGAELTIRSVDDAGSAAHARHSDAAVVPDQLRLTVRWRSSSMSEGSSRLPRCELCSEQPLMSVYLRSLEAMADAGSEVCPAP